MRPTVTCARVACACLPDVRKALADDEVRGDLDGFRRPRCEGDLDADLERRAGDDLLQRDFEPVAVRTAGWIPRARSRSSSSDAHFFAAPRRAACAPRDLVERTSEQLERSESATSRAVHRRAGPRSRRCRSFWPASISARDSFTSSSRAAARPAAGVSTRSPQRPRRSQQLRLVVQRRSWTSAATCEPSCSMRVVDRSASRARRQGGRRGRRYPCRRASTRARAAGRAAPGGARPAASARGRSSEAR